MGADGPDRHPRRHQPAKWVLLYVAGVTTSQGLKSEKTAFKEPLNPQPLALVGTLVSASDALPSDLMVPHQLDMLSGLGRNATRALVLVNRPPWLTEAQRQQGAAQAAQLRRLGAAGVATVRRVNYSVVDDLEFLRRMFVVHPRGSESQFLRRLATHTDIGSKSPGNHTASNVIGMLHFLDACISNTDVGLCVYLDPDIFLHRSGSRGLLDLAPRLFEGSPELVALQVPSFCHSPLVLQGLWNQSMAIHGGGGCFWTPQGYLSQRYLVFNRTRLSRLLPLQIWREDLNVFEKILNHALGVDRRGRLTGKTGRMLCGWHTFAIHPKGQLTPGGMPVEEHVAAVLASEHTAVTGGEDLRPSMSELLREGTQLLIHRMETGRFAYGVQGVTGNKCEDMNASRARIEAGLAW